MIGDGAVGKSSLLAVYGGKEMNKTHMPTIGLDYITKDFQPPGARLKMKV